MANYRNIVDVDMLDKASESTNILVEERGSLKKIPSSEIGGKGGGGMLIIHPEDPTFMEDTGNFFIGDFKTPNDVLATNQVILDMIHSGGTVYFSAGNDEFNVFAPFRYALELADSCEYGIYGIEAEYGIGVFDSSITIYNNLED